MKIKPLGIQVLVEPDPTEEKTSGGIIIPTATQTKEKPNRGTVIAVGEKVSPNIKPGSRIIYGKYSGVEIESDDSKFLIMKEQDIYGILE